MSQQQYDDYGVLIRPKVASQQPQVDEYGVPIKKKVSGGTSSTTSDIVSTPSASPSTLQSGLGESSSAENGSIFPAKGNPIPFPIGQPQPVAQTPPNTFTPNISNDFGLKSPTQLAQENASRPDNAQTAKIPILNRKSVLGENNGDILDGEDEGVKLASDYATQQKNLNTQKASLHSQILNIHQDVAVQKGDMAAPKLFTPIPIEENTAEAKSVNDLHGQVNAVDQQAQTLRQQTLQKASAYVSKLTNDPTTAGLTVRAILGDKNAIQQKKSLDNGNPVAPSDMYYNDRQGLESLSAGLDENYKDNLQDPEYISKKKSVSDQLLTLIDKYPEFKRQQISKIVAQEIMKEHSNTSAGGMALLPAVKQAAEKLGLSAEDVKNIDLDNLPIQSPFSSAVGAIYNGLISLGTGIARIGGSVAGVDENFLTSELADAKRKAEEKFTDISSLQGAPTVVDSDKNSPTYLQDIANPQAGKYNYNFHTVSNAIANGVGNLAQFIGGTRLLGGVASKIAPAVDATEAGMAGLMVGQGYEPYYQKAKEVISDKPEDEWKRHAYALINGSLDYYAFKGLGKVVRDVSPETISEGANIFKSASSLADVNRNALEKWTTKIVNGVKETAGETAFVGGAQAGSEIAKNIVDNVIGNSDAADKSNKEIGNVLLTGAESLPFAIMIPVGLSKVVSGAKNSYVYKENIYNAGLNPETYLGQASKLLSDGVINNDQYNQRAQVINTATKVVNSIPPDIELNHNQRVAYTNSKIRELALKAQVEKVDDTALEKYYNDQIQQEVANRTEILNGGSKQPSYEQTTPTNETPQAEIKVPAEILKDKTIRNSITREKKMLESFISSDKLSEEIKNESKSDISLIESDPLAYFKKALQQEQKYNTQHPNDPDGKGREDHLGAIIDRISSKMSSKSGNNTTNEAVDNVSQKTEAGTDEAGKLWDEKIAEGNLGVFKNVPKEEGIKMVAEQAQNISGGTDADNVTGDAYQSTVNQFGKELVDAAIKKHPKEALIAEAQIGDNAQATLSKIDSGEPVNENEISDTENHLYDVLSKNSGAENLIEPLILKVQNYDNKTKTKTVETVPINKVEPSTKQQEASGGKTATSEPAPNAPLPTKEEISKYSPKDKLAFINAIRNKDAKAIQEITERNRGGSVKLDKSSNVDAAFETRDGKRIGFDYDTDKVARERFDFSKLKKIGKGSDRTVFDLGDGKVLKVAHTARGLEQNIYEGDHYLKGIVPDVHERGLNYVVTDKVPRIKANDIVPTYDVETGEQNGTVKAGEMIRELSKFTQREFDDKTSGIQDVLNKYGFGDIMSYDVLYGDFKAGRNWGYEDGKPVHIDGGTFGGVRMITSHRGKAPLTNPEFRDIYNKSRALKKQFGDTDKNTKFEKAEIKTDNGTMPVEQYVSRAKAVLEKLFPKAKFETYDKTSDYLDAGGAYGSKGLSRLDSKGNRTIMLDLQEIRDSGSGKTAFHEVIHPIVDEVVGEHPEELNPLWNSLAEQMKDVEGFDKVLLHVMNYGAHEHPAAEGITELLTQISEGNISLDKVPPARRGAIVDLLNKIFEKLGLSIRFGDQYDFKSFATDIKKAFETGDVESLKSVVDKKAEQNQKAKDNASKIAKLFFGSDKADKSETDINEVVKQLRELGLTDEEIADGLKQAGDSEVDIKNALGGGGKSGADVEGEGQGGGNAITHAAIDDFRREMGFEPFAHVRMTDAEVNAKADKAIADGYNVQNLFHDIAEGHNPNEVEVVILKKTKAAIDAAVEKNPSKANLKKAADFANAADVAGQIAGRAFRLRQDIDDVDVTKQSLGDFFVTRMRNKGVTPETITDAQKSEIQKQYNDLKDAHDKLEAKVAKLVEADAKKKAESAVKKMKDRTSSQPKKTHDEYVKERKSLVEQLKAAKEKAEERMKGITKSGFSITVTPEMVKIIGKIAFSHVSEGAQKLQEVSQRVFDEIKDVFEGVTQQDVVDVLAGAYNEVKPEKNDILKQMAALRSEAIKESALAKEKKDAQRLKTIKKTYQNKIDKLRDGLKTGKYLQEKDKPEPLKLDKEALALKDDYISVKQETQRLIAKDEWNKKTQGEKFKHNALEALNIPRTAMTFLDFSAVLSQAAVPTIVHPDLAAKSLPGMFKDTFSQKKFDRWLFDLKSSELYNEMKSVGEVYISDPHDGRLDKKEEAFMNNLIEKIPIVGTWLVKGSERAYLSYLNRMRVELYALGRDVLIRNGKTPENSPEAFKGLGSYVNNMTGRGGVPKSLELATPLISAGIFAPRLIASRLNLLGITDIPNIGVKVGTLGKHSIESGFYTKLPPEIRKMAILDMAKFVMFGSAVLGLAALVGNDDKKDKAVEFDARSSDFGKIKVGDTRYDIWGGFQPYVTFFAREITSKTKSINGREYKLDGKGAFGQSQLSVAGRFARGKLAPIPSMVVDFADSHRTVVGDKILYGNLNPFGEHKKKEITGGSYLLNHFSPMTGGDIYDALKEGDIRNLFAIPATIFGIHVQTYNDKK